MSHASQSAPAALVPADLLAACRAVLAKAPAALITDIDGTISRIAPTPAAAVVEDHIRESLSRLAGQLAAVGVVTGRAAPTAAAMLALPELVYFGNHGMERFQHDTLTRHPAASAAIDAIAAALATIASGLPEAAHPWQVVENKGVTASLHYRLAPDPAAAYALMAPVVNAAAARHGLLVTEGRLIFELRPRIAVNKGTALVELVEELGLRGLIFLGDDLTDIDGFLALQEMRAGGVIDGLAIGVLGAESHPRVAETMDVGLAGVAAVAALLDALSRPEPASAPGGPVVASAGGDGVS